MTIGTNDLRGHTITALRQMYREARAAALAAAGVGGYEKVGGFDRFAESFIRLEDGDSKIERARRFTAFAINQVFVKMNRVEVVQPSPETLEWGGFLQAEHRHHESADARRIVDDILARRPA